ncbi:MAG: VC0807 family protein [Candidatus Dormibacteria bacterium]
MSVPVRDRGRIWTLAPILVFDVIGPLVTYFGLSAAGFSSVEALVLSGAAPAFGVAVDAVRNRRLDAIGILVLLGIGTGTVLGVVSGSAHLVLLDGTVPTAVFGVVCLSSLWWKRPLMYRFALETIGRDTPNGRDFADRWRYPGFRRAFHVVTVVWGLSFLVEAAAHLVIIETTSTAIAKTTSSVMPLVVTGGVVAWNVAYAKRGQRAGERAAAAARARGESVPPMPG